MSSMRSGGATPEIRQNYSGGHIVFNAIHACSHHLIDTIAGAAGYDVHMKDIAVFFSSLSHHRGQWGGSPGCHKQKKWPIPGAWRER